MALSAGLQLLALFFPPVRTVLGGAALPLVDVGIAALGAVVPIAPIVLIEIERAELRSGSRWPLPSTLAAAGPGASAWQATAMSERRLFTSSSVLRGHPDKLCDRISDALVDAHLALDPQRRIRAEAAAAGQVVFVVTDAG